MDLASSLRGGLGLSWKKSSSNNQKNESRFIALWNEFLQCQNEEMELDRAINLLNRLTSIILEEEKQNRDMGAGPCIEYFLNERCLSKIVKLAEQDIPQGIMPTVLTMAGTLYASLNRRFLAHISMYKPIVDLIRKGSESGQDKSKVATLINSVILKLKEDPELVGLFFTHTQTEEQEISFLRRIYYSFRSCFFL